MVQQIEQIDLSNTELQQALQLLNYTTHSVYLTGKAGTGKSTFLRYISRTTKKKHVVLAPTGIAAINVGGATLHSFFKLPFHPLLPNDTRYSVRHIKDTLKYNGEKRKLLLEIELIIIDEISMVRADIIDFIDKVLRIYTRNMREPFGGKQLLLVGDIFQLEPVVKEEDRQMLTPFYQSAFFFNAKVFEQMKLVSIELNKVYRQGNDPTFIHILNRMRIAKPLQQDLDVLNQRVNATIDNQQGKLAITLSTHRDTVDHINEHHLAELDGKLFTFFGEVEGDFPESAMPTPLQLELKCGAQILFIKNDKEKRWVNGTLGTIISVDEIKELIEVMTEDGQLFDVEKEIWSNVRYTFNEKEQKVEEQEIGTYTQFPIRLAWAITIHKSQGLTFNNVKIDFSNGVFAGGQAYVALSRGTSLNGISLTQPIRRENIFVRTEVTNFARNFNNSEQINNTLKESKANAEYKLCIENFNGGNFKESLDHFFLAIHSRYDIEKPHIKRYIQKKLSIINTQKTTIEQLQKRLHERDKFLKELSVEYYMMGRDCERDGFRDAAERNYEKALKLWEDNLPATRKLKALKKKKSEQ